MTVAHVRMEGWKGPCTAEHVSVQAGIVQVWNEWVQEQEWRRHRTVKREKTLGK